ncbi:MAG: hypothetical protein U0232_27130 [Thermomicrobiales bacterium]
MLGSQILEVGIGLVFVYYLLSLLCTVVNELIARIFGLRSGTLIKGIRALIADGEMALVVRPSWWSRLNIRSWFGRRSDLLNGAPLTRALYRHPLIGGLYKPGLTDKNGGRPSYIAADTFTTALLHTLREQLVPSLTLDVVEKEIAAWAGGPLEEVQQPLREALATQVQWGATQVSLEAVKTALSALNDDDAKRELPARLEGRATGDPKVITVYDIKAAILDLPARPLNITWKTKLLADLLMPLTLPLSFADVAAAVQSLYKNPTARLRPLALERLARLADATHPPRLNTPLTFGDIRRIITNLPEERYGDLKRALTALANEAEGDLTKFRQQVAGWYDEAMERVSGWYKRKVQLIVLLIAFVLAVAMNADSLTLANTFWRDGTLRAAVAAAAEQQAASASSSAGSFTQLAAIQNELDALSLPFGWHCGDVSWCHWPWDAAPSPQATEPGKAVPPDPRLVPRTFGDLMTKLFGLGITILALTLGAPFWFDLLGKVVSLRATGSPPAKAEDQQGGGGNNLT